MSRYIDFGDAIKASFQQLREQVVGSETYQANMLLAIKVEEEAILDRIMPVLACLQKRPRFEIKEDAKSVSSELLHIVFTYDRFFETLDKRVGNVEPMDCYKKGTALSPEDCATHLRENLCLKRKWLEELYKLPYVEQGQKSTPTLHDFLKGLLKREGK